MHPVICIFLCLTIGQTLVSGASTTPAATSPPPASSSPPPAGSSTPPADLGLVPPGAPDVTSCSDKKPCTDKNSKCTDGRCLCNEGYAYVGNDTCLKSPGLGEVCRKGDTELFCTGDGVEYFCPINGTICQCKAGYESDGKTCKETVRLVGAACKVNGDCTAAFTSCEKGKCTCIEGFKADSKTSLCTPTEYKCFDNDKPLEEKGNVRLCEIIIDEFSNQGNDTCPPTHFCNQWQDSKTLNRTLPGHCCPKPPENKNVTATCPIGVPHKTGKCVDWSKFPADSTAPPDLGPLCPFGEYDCLHGSICCPLACRTSNGYFNVDGKCYESRILEQPCELDVQCLPNSQCVKGKCQCKAGYKQVERTYCLAPGEPNPFNPPPQTPVP